MNVIKKKQTDIFTLFFEAFLLPPRGWRQLIRCNKAAAVFRATECVCVYVCVGGWVESHTADSTAGKSLWAYPYSQRKTHGDE